MSLCPIRQVVMSRMSDWDCIVVGAGIIGSWAAYHLSSNGRQTLLLDQFMLPHTRGSSGGQSRIIRKAYTKSCYTQMMSEAYSWWEKLERDSGLQLYRKTGMLILQHKNEKGAVEESQIAMDEHNLPYKLLTSEELAANYPSIKGISDCKGLLDTDAGLLLPSRCLIAVQDEFKKRGGTIQDGEKVENIIPGTPVTVITSRKVYKANKVIIAAGPWSKDILAKTGVDLPVKTMPGLSVFFKEQPSSVERFSADSGFPLIYTYLYYRPDGYRFICAFPSLEYPGMVKLVTRGEPPAYYCHPDERDTRGSQDLVSILIQYVKQHLPDLDPTPKIMEPCVYSMTPDRDYIIDYHPMCKNIVIAAGFSGHGYMRAPVIGLLLTELIRDIPTSYDMMPYKLDRFKRTNIKSSL